MDLKGQFTNATLALEFMFAGNAVVTIRSKTTGNRYTFKVKKANFGERWFIKYLVGPDNENDYAYVGSVTGKPKALSLTKASKLTLDSPPVKAFHFALGHLIMRNQIHPQLEIWHEGSCGRCNRQLTVPESVYRGLGPECVKHITREAS